MRPVPLLAALLVLLAVLAALFLWQPEREGGSSAATTAAEQAPAAAAARGAAPAAGVSAETGEGGRAAVAGAPVSGAPPAAAGAATLVFRLVDGRTGPAPGARARWRLEEEGGATFGILEETLEAARQAAEAAAGGVVEVDGAGSGRLDHLPVGVPLTVSFGGPHWQRQSVTVAPLAPGEIRDLGRFALAPGAVLRGRVSGERDQALAGARILLQGGERAEWWAPAGVYQELDSTRSDEGGEYLLEGVPPGRLRLLVQSPGYVPAALQPLEVPAGGVDLRHDFQLERGATLRGRITGLNGQPLPEARVLLSSSLEGAAEWGLFGADTPSIDPGWLLEHGTPVDRDGVFLLSGVAAGGRDRVAAAAPGHAVAFSPAVAAGQEVMLQLRPTSWLRGVVRDAQRQAVSGAQIELNPLPEEGQDDESRQPGTALSSADGTFEVAGLVPGSYELRATSPLGRASQQLAVPVEGTTVDIQLEAGAQLLVRVADASGQPLSGAELRLGAAAPEQHTSAEWSTLSALGYSGDTAPGFYGLFTARTGADGTARFAGLPAGRYEVTVRARGYAGVRELCELVENGREELPVLLPRSAALRILVVDAAGTPLAGTTLSLRPAAEEPGRYQPESYYRATDHQGLAHWEELGPGNWEIYAASSGELFAQGWAPFGDHQESEPGSSTVAPDLRVSLEEDTTREERIVWPGLAVLQVRVTRYGEPTPGALVQAFPVLETDSEELFYAGFEGAKRTDGAGEVLLGPFRPGRMRIAACLGLRQPATELERDFNAGLTEVHLSLATGVVRGVVYGAGGPLAEAQATLLRRGGGATGADSERPWLGVFYLNLPDGQRGAQMLNQEPGQAGTRTGRDGGYEFHGVSAGNYRLHVTAPGHSQWSSPIFQHDGRQILDLGLVELQPAGSVRGKILGLGPDPGSPQRGWIHLEKEDGNEAGGQSLQATWIGLIGGDGGYSFADLPPGRYRLQVNLHERGAPAHSEWFEVGASPLVFDFTMP